ncbi:MAG: hypothetical protein ACYDD5_12390 [Sulfuricurvum sp.]
MMTLKLKLLTGRSGDDGSYSPGDQIELPIREAIALVESDQAVPTNKKEYEKALATIDQIKRDDDEKEAQATAILEKNTLVSELRDLYAQVALKAAQIEGVVFTDEEVEAFVEKSMNGEDPGDENIVKDPDPKPADVPENEGDKAPVNGEDQ